MAQPELTLSKRSRLLLQRKPLISVYHNMNGFQVNKKKTSLTSHSVRLLFSCSHFRSLQICLPILRFRQFAQLPQFSLRRHGVHVPHFLLLFFWSTAASREASEGESVKSPACWCSLSIYLLSGDVFSKDFLYKWRDWASSPSKENSKMSSGGGPGPAFGLGMMSLLSCAYFCL